MSDEIDSADVRAGPVTRTIAGVVAAAGLVAGDLISTTATDAAGNTSEFSAAASIPSAAFFAGGSGSGSRSALDVSADGNITGLDALMVINDLGDQGEGGLPLTKCELMSTEMAESPRSTHCESSIG